MILAGKGLKWNCLAVHNCCLILSLFYLEHFYFPGIQGLYDLLRGQAMLCWGHSDFGQLGVNHGSISFILEPIASTFSLSRCVRQVACGENHSIFLLDDGRVYSCGGNSVGQLGQDHHDREPGIVYYSFN